MVLIRVWDKGLNQVFFFFQLGACLLKVLLIKSLIQMN